MFKPVSAFATSALAFLYELSVKELLRCKSYGKLDIHEA